MTEHRTPDHDPARAHDHRELRDQLEAGSLREPSRPMPAALRRSLLGIPTSQVARPADDARHEYLYDLALAQASGEAELGTSDLAARDRRLVDLLAEVIGHCRSLRQMPRRLARNLRAIPRPAALPRWISEPRWAAAACWLLALSLTFAVGDASARFQAASDGARRTAWQALDGTMSATSIMMARTEAPGLEGGASATADGARGSRFLSTWDATWSATWEATVAPHWSRLRSMADAGRVRLEAGLQRLGDQFPVLDRLEEADSRSPAPSGSHTPANDTEGTTPSLQGVFS